MFARRYYEYRWSQLIHDDINVQGTLLKRISEKASLLPSSTLIEFFIIIIQPLPFYDFHITMYASYPTIEYKMTLSELLYILMFTKLYVIIRYVINSSVYNNSDAKLLWYPSY